MNKTLKIILSCVIALIIIIAAIFGVWVYLNRQTPTKVVTAYFTDLNTGKFEEATALLDNSENTSTSTEKNQSQAYFTTYASSIQATIIEEHTEKEKATVKVKVNKIDMQSIFEEYIKETFANLFSNANKTEEQLTTDSNQFFEEKIKDPNVKRMEKEYTLNLVKIDKEWKIVNDDALSKAVLDVEELSTSPEAVSETPVA